MFTYKVEGMDLLLARANKFEKKLIRQGIKNGLKRGAFDVREDEIKSMQRLFDRPVPWILRAVTIKAPTIANLTAYVYVQPDQARLLSYQVFGGTAYKRKVVPARNYPRNAYGNLPKNTTRGKSVLRTFKWGQTIYWRIRGSKGNRHVEKIGFIPMKRSYRKYWDFYGIGKRSARIWPVVRVAREIQKAMIAASV